MKAPGAPPACSPAGSLLHGCRDKHHGAELSHKGWGAFGYNYFAKCCFSLYEALKYIPEPWADTRSEPTDADFWFPNDANSDQSFLHPQSIFFTTHFNITIPKNKYHSAPIPVYITIVTYATGLPNTFINALRVKDLLS